MLDEDDEYSFFKPAGSRSKKPNARLRSAKLDGDSSALENELGEDTPDILKKVKKESGNYKISSRGIALSKGDLGRAVASRIKLDELKKNTILKSGLKHKPLGVSAEKIQQHCFAAPPWMEQCKSTSRIELYFKVGPDRLLDERSLRAYFLPTKAWYEANTIRVDIKSFDIDTYISIAAAINAACFTPSAWSRLEPHTSWYLVYRWRLSSDSRLPSDTGRNLQFTLEAVRHKPEDGPWVWSFVSDSQTFDKKGKISGGRFRSGKDPRQILYIQRLLPHALYRMKPMPKAVFTT